MVTAPQDEIGASKPDWPAPAQAVEDGRRFLRSTSTDGKLLVVYHGDVDGLSAAALMVKALRRKGRGWIEALSAGKGENVHTPSMQEKMRALNPAALVVLDMGSRGEPILPAVPTLLIDHHQPRGFPPGAVVVSAYDRPPIAPASLLTYLLLRPRAPLDDLAWLAVLGTVGDLGPEAPFPGIQSLLKRYRHRPVTEAISLLNAAQRAPEHDVAAAFDVLMRAHDPADISMGRVEGVVRLYGYRDEVQAEVNRCAHAKPRFAGQIALVRFSSPARVHPLLASRWAHHLP